MANIPLKDIEFPGLGDTYTLTLVDNTLTQTGKAADAKVVGDALTAIDSDIEDLETGKANKDGYYEDLTAGDAEQLVSTIYAEDQVPYNFRSTGGSADVGNRAYVDKIAGGTVAWNQLFSVPVNDVSDTSNNVTFVDNRDGTYTISTTSDGASGAVEFGRSVFKTLPVISGHVYLKTGADIIHGVQLLDSYLSWYLTSANAALFKKTGTDSYNMPYVWVLPGSVITTPVTIAPMFIDLTQMFGTAIADYIYGLEQATAGAGVAFFRSLFPKEYYSYNAGELLSVNASSKETVGFNQFDISSAVANSKFNPDGTIVTDNDYTRSDYIRCIPNAEYCFTVKGIAGTSYGCNVVFFDSEHNFANSSSGWVGSNQTAGTDIVNTLTAPANAYYMGISCLKTDIARLNVNLAWSGYRNGEFEDYIKRTYPLDSSLTLRGIPKLDGDNKLYYDGDEYLPDSTVNRRYGVVDLGTLGWTREATGNNYRFQSSIIAEMKSQTCKNILCPRYVLDISPIYGADTNKVICNYRQLLFVVDNNYTDAATFKTAMSGVYLVYEKTTPTTETAEAYNTVQIVDDFGTESYVDYAESQGTRDVAIPVGHSTRYPANLRDKLQHLPDPASGNGDYLIRQTGNDMTLIPYAPPTGLPDAPTTDGVYTLKATVAEGVVTYSWEVET